MMDSLREEQLQEAEIRKDILSKKFNLKKDAFNLEEFKKDDFYAKIIEKFEKDNDRVVYHCILTYGRILNLLYVSKYKEDWDYERPSENGSNVVAYTMDLTIDYPETGDIFLDSEDGYLIRVN